MIGARAGARCAVSGQGRASTGTNYGRLKETQKAKQHLRRYQALAELERKQKATIDLSTE